MYKILITYWSSTLSTVFLFYTYARLTKRETAIIYLSRTSVDGFFSIIFSPVRVFRGFRFVGFLRWRIVITTKALTVRLCVLSSRATCPQWLWRSRLFCPSDPVRTRSPFVWWSAPFSCTRFSVNSTRPP